MNIARGMLRAAVLVLLPCAARGLHVEVPPAAPEYADTEASTNVAFNRVRADAREVRLHFSFAGVPSNCVQVAFGRDDDGNGDLSADETDVAIGWRAGDWFIEDVKGVRRFREDGALGERALPAGSESGGQGLPALPRRLMFRVAAGEDGAKSASVVCDGVTKLGEVLGGDLRWLYDRGWNMAKVTRRGVDSPGEIVLVASDHGGMKFIVR